MVNKAFREIERSNRKLRKLIANTPLIEPDHYTITDDQGVEWDVFKGTHRLHYRCKHGVTHIVTWSDWNTPDEIPPHPVCDDPFDNCGPLQIVAGCHSRHDHGEGPRLITDSGLEEE